MTGNLLLDLLISAGGVAVLVGLSAFLGAWKSTRIDDASARERIRFDEPDFPLGDVAVSADGKAAVAFGADGREAVVVFAVGDGIASRRIAISGAIVSLAGEAVEIALSDPTRRRIRLLAPDAATGARWAGALSGGAYNQPHDFS